MTRHFVIGGTDVTEGTEVAVRAGWNMSTMANGRNTLQFEVISLDALYRPLIDTIVRMYERVNITVSASGDPSSTITTEEPHGLVTGRLVGIGGHSGSSNDVAVNAWHWCTVLTPTTFTIPVVLTSGGTGGWAHRRVFGGNISKPTESSLGDSGMAEIVTLVDAVDHNAQAERRYINATLAAGTLKSQLTTICSLCGFTLHPLQATGPDMLEMKCEYALVRDVLEKFTTSTPGGYVWEWDSHNYLRMYLPNTEAAPFDVVDGDGHHVGDIKIAPSRSNYANRVILRFSNSPSTAYAFLFTQANFGAGETVSVGGQTYTFRASMPISEVSGDVLIGDTVADSLAHLAHAIEAISTHAGEWFSSNTSINGAVWANPFGDTALKAVAKVAGASGNSVGVSSGAPDALWGWEGFSWPANPELWEFSNLLGGTDAALVNSVMVEDATAQSEHGVWEIVVSYPEINNEAQAHTYADAVLVVRLLCPNMATYSSYGAGLLPGQRQRIASAKRNTDSTFLLSDVTFTHQENDRVLCEVTAIEGLLLKVADRWQDLYKEWLIVGSAGGGSISGGGSSGGGGLTVFNAGPVVIHLGGSRYHAVQL
jgi:hypothetical protein